MFVVFLYRSYSDLRQLQFVCTDWEFVWVNGVSGAARWPMGTIQVVLYYFTVVLLRQEN